MNRYILIYDDACPVCLAGLEQIRKFDTAGLIEQLPLSDVGPASFPELPEVVELRKAIHLITPDGSLYRGAEAIAALADLFPQMKVIRSLFALPGIKPVAHGVYHFIARHRMTISSVLGADGR